MTAANLLAYFLQITVLVLACAALPRALRVRSPGLHYGFFRVVLAVCLLLPLVEPIQRHELKAVQAPSAALWSTAIGAAAIIPPVSGPTAVSFAIRLAGIMMLVGMAARLAWLGVGMRRLQRPRACGAGATQAFDDLKQAMGAPAAILWSADVRHPAMFGLLRPVVLLPVALSSADPAAQRAVVAHELHHVARHDWAWVVGEEIVRSIFWFHPAVWWLISRVQLARETVVDELAVLTTNARRIYLETLLEFADSARLSSTPAFSARRHLFHRVTLLSKENNMSSFRVTAASCVLTVALAACSLGAVYAFPLFSITPGVEANSPAPDLRAQSDSRGDVQTQEPPMPPEFAAALERLKPVRVGKNVKPPTQATKTVKAEYPPDAKAAGLQGDVQLETIVDTYGKVAAVRVVHSIPGLDDAAVQAAKLWEFTPTLLNGAPTSVLCTMVMTFRLK